MIATTINDGVDALDAIRWRPRRGEIRNAVLVGEVILHEGCATHWFWNREAKDVSIRIGPLASK